MWVRMHSCDNTRVHKWRGQASRSTVHLMHRWVWTVRGALCSVCVRHPCNSLLLNGGRIKSPACATPAHACVAHACMFSHVLSYRFRLRACRRGAPRTGSGGPPRSVRAGARARVLGSGGQEGRWARRWRWVGFGVGGGRWPALAGQSTRAWALTLISDRLYIYIYNHIYI